METDAPYLLPRNLNPKPASRRNEPMYLPAVVGAIAQATGRDIPEVGQRTADNARHFFGLAQASTQPQSAASR